MSKAALYPENPRPFNTVYFITELLKYAIEIRNIFKMERKVLSCNLVNENLVIVPPMPQRYTIEDYVLDARQKNRVSQDQQILADRVLE